MGQWKVSAPTLATSILMVPFPLRLSLLSKVHMYFVISLHCYITSVLVELQPSVVYCMKINSLDQRSFQKHPQPYQTKKTESNYLEGLIVVNMKDGIIKGNFAILVVFLTDLAGLV